MNLKLPAPLRDWFGGLAPRERKLVIAGAGVLVLLLLYLAVISPVTAAHQRLVNDIHRKQALLALINGSAGRLQSTNQATGHLQPGQSVFAATSAAIQSSPIKSAVQRLEQVQSGGVRLSLSDVHFDALTRWLSTLSDQDGIVVKRANIEQSSDPGSVNATLTLDTPS